MPDAADPADALRADLRRQRYENRLAREKMESRRLAASARHQQRRAQLLESMSLDWVTPYAELLDRYRNTGDPIITGPTSFWQRRKGRNWPIYQTEQELNLLRAPARLLVATTSYAQGLLSGLTSYVIGSGYTYRMAKKRRQSEVPDELIQACQRVVDDFLKLNQWYGGEQPGLEEELFERSVEDGEFALISNPQDDGTTQVRTAEPEQITAPPGEALERDESGTPTEDGGFGVITPAEDVQCVRAYWVQWGDSPTDGERIPADRLTHFRRNVRRSMKRGVTDFSFDTLDALDLAGKLRTNLGDGAAQQAAIVMVRQHATGSQSDIEAFQDAQANFTKRDPLSGEELRYRKARRGGAEDIPEGMQYVDGPGAHTGAPAHLQVLQGLLRSAGVKWNAPEWLASGDASNNNYSSSLTAESPFVRTVIRRQRGYREAFRRPVWSALKHYVETRGLHAAGREWTWEEIERELDLLVEAPSPETRNRLQEAQQAQIEIPLGTDSRQQYTQRQGRDWDQVESDNQEWEDQQGGAGGQLPLPGDPDADGLPGAAPAGAASDPLPDAPPAAADSTPGPGGSLLQTVGGANAVADLQERYAKGELTREMAITNATLIFGMEQSAAERLFPAGAEGAKAKTESLLESGGPHKFGCAMVVLDGPAAAALLALAARVADADLADDGREDEPHVTVRYGLHTDDAREVAALLADAPPVQVRLGAVTLFPGAEGGKDYDVIKADVEGDDLPRLHARLGGLPHTDTHAGYKPHATIAYVKAGLGAKYAAEFGRVDQATTAGRLIYSTADGLRTTIPLRGVGLVESVSEDTYQTLVGIGRWLTEADAGLVAKQVTVHPAAGKPYQRTVMVRPDAGGGARTPAAGAGAHTPGPPREHTLAGLEDAVKAADPEAAANPGLMARIGDRCVTAAAKVHLALVRLTPAMLAATKVLEGVFDTPADMKEKFGYNPTATSGTASPTVADPVRDSLGISSHLAATLASHVLAKGLVYAKAKIAAGRHESEQPDVYDDLGEILSAAMAAAAAEFGLSAPPAAVDIAARLRSYAGVDRPESVSEETFAAMVESGAWLAEEIDEAGRTVMEAGTGLVPKKITVTTKAGKTYQRTVMVRPDAPGGGVKPPPKADPAAAHARVRAALGGDPKKLTAGAVKQLAADLGTLTVPQIQALQKEHGAAGGRLKAERVERLLAKAKEMKKGAGPVGRKPGAKATATEPGRVKVADLTRTLNRISKTVFELSDSKPYSSPKHLAAIREVMAATGVDGGQTQRHGMSRPEITRKVVIGDVAVHWPEGSEKAAAAAASTIATLVGMKVPKLLADSTGEIVITSQANRHDPFWAERYDIPGFVSRATGGDGTTVVYSEGSADPHTLTHEAGHNLAHKLWGGTAPPDDSEYGRAQRAEAPVSEYGSKAPAEDFAEAVSHYALGGKLRDRLRVEFPKKYAALETIFREP